VKSLHRWRSGKQSIVKGVQQNTSEMSAYRALTTPWHGELMSGKIQKTLQPLVQTNKAWFLEQTRQTLIVRFNGRRRLCGKIENQHVVAAPPGEGMSFVAGYQACMQATNCSALPHDFKIRATV
jgi:hypothetical protein